MTDIVIIRCFQGDNAGKATVYAETKEGKDLMLRLWETWENITVPNNLAVELIEDFKKIDGGIVVEVK